MLITNGYVKGIKDTIDGYLNIVTDVETNPDHHNYYLASKMEYCANLLKSLREDLLYAAHNPPEGKGN